MSRKHLVKRKNSFVYHYRIIAPTDLKSVLIQQSLEISLFTGIQRIAQSRARKLNQLSERTQSPQWSPSALFRGGILGKIY